MLVALLSNDVNVSSCVSQPVAACAMPVMKGWNILTNSEKTRKARYKDNIYYNTKFNACV